MTLTNEIESADMIFQGIPITKNQKGFKTNYHFYVQKVWKGNPIDTVIIETGLGGSDCGEVFEIGKSYIIYSRKNYTNFCRRNALAENSFDDLKLDYKLLPEYSLHSFTGTEKELNEKEYEYLNRQFKKWPKKYNFNGKSILFTSNQKVISKQEWFKCFWNHDEPVVELVELTEKEKLETGYDAILVTYCKRKVSDRIKKRILKQIN